MSDDVTDSSRGIDDFWLVKIDANGIKQWDRKYGGSTDELLKNIKPTFEGGYILGGITWSPDSYEVSEPSYGVSDYWIIKLDSDFNKEWDMRFGGAHNELGGSVIQTSDSGYLVGGSSISRLSGNKTQDVWRNYDYWVVRINSQHKILWDSRYGGKGGNDIDIQGDLLQTSDGNFLLGGTSDSFIGNDKSVNNHGIGSNDFWIIKINDAGFQPDSGIALIVVPERENINALKIYPNPFSSMTTISFSIKENSYITLKLFDISGRQVICPNLFGETLPDENLNAGNHTVQLNREQLNAGIYFLKLKMNNQASTVKIIIE